MEYRPEEQLIDRDGEDSEQDNPGHVEIRCDIGEDAFLVAIQMQSLE